MAVRAVLESLEGVDEALQGHYREAGGKYVLEIDVLSQHPDLAGLRSTLEKQKKEIRGLKEAVREFDGIDLEEIAQLREKAAAGGKPDPEEMEKLRKQIADSARKEFERELAKRDEELTTTRSLLERRVVDGDLSSALEKVGVKPAARRIILDHFKARGPKVVADGEQGPVAMFETEMGPQSAAALIESWAKSEEAQEFLAATGKGGSGAGNGAPAAGSGGRVTFDRNDPLAFGKYAEALLKGEATAR